MFLNAANIFLSQSNTINYKMKGWCFMGYKYLQYLALTVAIIGAINWGLIGFLDFNLVAFLFGSMSWLSRIVYGLVGLCGLYLFTFYSFIDND